MANSNKKIIKTLATIFKGVAVASIGYITTKTIKKSIIDRSNELEEAKHLPPVSPVPGSIVICKLAGPLAEHSGIYIGDCQYGKDIIVDLHITNNGNYEIGAVTAEKFLSNVIGDHRIYVSTNGTEAIGNKDIARRALESIGNCGKYNIIGDNCHMFSAYCISGKYQKIVTNATLTSLLNKHLKKLGHKAWRLWYTQAQEANYKERKQQEDLPI